MRTFKCNCIVALCCALMAAASLANGPSMGGAPKGAVVLDLRKIDREGAQTALVPGQLYFAPGPIVLSHKNQAIFTPAGKMPAVIVADLNDFARLIVTSGAAWNTRIENIEIRLRNDTSYGFGPGGRNLKIKGVTIYGGGFILAEGCAGPVEADRITVKGEVGRYIIYMGGGTPERPAANADFTIDHLTAVDGSKKEALIRPMTARNFKLINSRIDSTAGAAGKYKQALQARGFDGVIQNCVIVGSTVTGQLADGNTDAKRVARWVFEGCEIQGYNIVESGAEATFSNCKLRISGGGGIGVAATWASYLGRGAAKVTLDHVDAVGGSTISVGPVMRIGSTWNGKAVK